jgi:secreted trypsin-like serine protease
MFYYRALLVSTVVAFAEKRVPTEQGQVSSANVVYLVVHSFITHMSTSKSVLKLNGSPRIIGGQEAPEGRYPYAVSLVYPDGSHECGGSLIAPNIVLSAAHCAEDSTHVQIGRHDRSDLNDEYEELSILHKLVHPLYDQDLSYLPMAQK